MKVCLYALADHLGTETLIDTSDVGSSIEDLVEATGLNYQAVDHSLSLARAHDWFAVPRDGDYWLKVPGENVAMYEDFLRPVREPVRDPHVY